VALPGAAFAGGPAPVATRIDVTSVVTPSIAVPATSGTPAVYVVKGIDFTVDLAFGDGTTSLPLSYTKDTTVSLKVVAGPDTGTSWTKTVPAGQTATTFTGLQFAHAGNGAVLQASTVAKKPADQISSDPTATPHL
jgi:hypothetical protein